MTPAEIRQQISRVRFYLGHMAFSALSDLYSVWTSIQCYSTARLHQCVCMAQGTAVTRLLRTSHHSSLWGEVTRRCRLRFSARDRCRKQLHRWFTNVHVLRGTYKFHSHIVGHAKLSQLYPCNEFKSIMLFWFWLCQWLTQVRRRKRSPPCRKVETVWIGPVLIV